MLNDADVSAHRGSVRGIAPTVLALGIAIAAIVLSLALPSAPEAKTAQAPLAEFSAGRALRHLETVARECHPVGSPAHDRVRDYVAAQIRGFGLEPQIQKTVVVRPELARACAVENVLTRLVGVDRGKAVVLVAHYDSAPVSYGAADAGTPVAALLETLRALVVAQRSRRDVVFLFSDAEEMGLMGAQAFVDEHPWARDVGVVLNFEARGTSGSSILFETGPGNAELIRRFARVAPFPIANSLAYEVYRLMPNDTDFSVFKRAGLNGLNFAFIGSPWNYHTPLDSIANLDPRSLQHQGEQALALARSFAESIPEPTATSAVDFNLLGARMVSYSQRWLLPLHAVICLGCLSLIVLAGKRSMLAPSRIGVGVVILLLICVVAAGVAVILAILLEQAHLRLGIGGMDSFLFNGAYVAGLSSAVLAALAASYSVLRARWDWTHLAAAGVLLWAGLAVVTGFVVPGGSYLFTWPALFSLLAMLGFAGYPSDRRSAWIATGLAVLGILPSVLILPPLLSMLGVAMGLRLPVAGSVGLVVALGWFTAVPLIDSAWRARRHLLTILAAAAAVLFLGAGMQWARTSGPSFRSARLQYVLDQDTAKAYWVTRTDRREPWIGTLMPHPRRGHPYLTGEFASRFEHQETAVAALPEPTVQIVEDHVDNHTRTFVLRVRCTDRPIRLRASNDQLVTMQVALDGKPLRQPGEAESVGFSAEMINPGEDGFDLALTVARSATPIAVQVDADFLGLPQLANVQIPPRPPELLPERWGDSSSVRKSFRIR